MTKRLGGVLLLLAGGTAWAANGPTIAVDELACAPLRANSVVAATVAGQPDGAAVRFYFRRLHQEVEDFYYLEMRPGGGGRYWAVLPRPAEEQLKRYELKRAAEEQAEARSVAWWKTKEVESDRDPNDDLDAKTIRDRASVGRGEARGWLASGEPATLESWLKAQQYEPAEYYGAIVDPATGAVLARSPVLKAPVTRECRVTLTPQQAGLAANLTVGETSGWQRGDRPFNWLCDGIVTRIDPAGITRSDDRCRTCALVWWKNPGVYAGLGAIALISVDNDDPETSPSRP